MYYLTVDYLIPFQIESNLPDAKKRFRETFGRILKYSLNILNILKFKKFKIFKIFKKISQYKNILNVLIFFEFQNIQNIMNLSQKSLSQ